MRVKQLRDYLNNLGSQFDNIVVVSKIAIRDDGFSSVQENVKTDQFVKLDIDDIKVIHDINLKLDQSDSIEKVDKVLNIMDMNIDLNLDNRSSAEITIEHIKAE